MSRMFRRSATIFTCGFLCFAALLHSDVIVLTNGRKIEGNVIFKNHEQIIIELPMGEMTFPADQVEDIIPGEKKPKSAKGSRGKNLAGEVDALKRGISSLHRKKGTIALYESRADQLSERLERLRAEQTNLRSEIVALDRQRLDYEKDPRLRTSSAKYRAYSEVVQQRNERADEINQKGEEINGLISDLADEQAKLSGLQGDFYSDLSELKKEYRELYEADPEGNWVSSLNIGDLFEEDLERGQRIPLRRVGNSYWVTALLNDQIEVEFILDTGCSEVLMSKNTAVAAGVGSDDIEPSGFATIADGSKKPVNAAILNSISVGPYRVEEVITLMPADGQNQDIEPLLGMGFLRHFQFSIDSRTAELVLSPY